MTLRLNGSTSGYVELDAPAVAGTTALTLPATSGTVATQAYANTAGGLVHINTATFTTQSSIIFNNVFSAAYENYLIMCNGISSVTDTARIRYRVSGTSNSTANSYSSQRANFDGGATLFSRSTGDSGEFAVFGQTLRNSVSFTTFGPFIAQPTVSHLIEGFDNAGAWNAEIKTTRHNQTVSYDGLEIFFNGGVTLTGTIRIFGYKNGA